MKTKANILIIILSLSMISFQTKDRFVGKIITEWLDNGRDMKLLEDFIYIDPNGKTWKAPAEFIINGASIPKAFWTIIGGPYEDSYRKASVIHDYYCTPPYKEKWQNVHLMFYNACLTAGTDIKMAKLMYAAVYAGGPRWETTKIKKAGNAYETLNTPIFTTAPEDKFVGITKWIESENPELITIIDTLNTIVVEMK